MLDIAKRPLAIGQTVAFNPPHYKGLRSGTVLRFGKKMITVEFTDWNNCKKTHSVYPHDACIMEH